MASSLKITSSGRVGLSGASCGQVGPAWPPRPQGAGAQTARAADKGVDPGHDVMEDATMQQR